MIKHEEKQTKNTELHSYCYWPLNLTMKIHACVLSLGAWKLCITLVSHWFIAPHSQTTAPPLPPPVGGRLLCLSTFHVLLASCLSASPCL